MKSKNDPVLYGILSGLGLLIFYLAVLSTFSGIEFAFLNLRSLWYLVFPLVVGFGTQIGLFVSIKHDVMSRRVVGSTGGASAGSMVICCSHFLLNLLPIVGIAGISLILMSYQKAFLGIGIASNIVGIGFLINHKKKMKGDS